MKKEIEFGIGFVTGRENVCKIINRYYKDILEQIKTYEQKVNITIFILFDLAYQKSKREDFYNLMPEVYENIKVKYITPEDIKEEIKKLVSRNKMDYDDMNFFLGYGHAKGRNTVMYYAIKNKMDYLLFWDDDEYPVANISDGKEITWKTQENVLKHIQFMKQETADITIGHHCGYISPIPYIDFDEEFREEDFKNFIEAISNDIISWESIKEKMQKDNGVTYADSKIANGIGNFEIEMNENGKWIAGSTLCLNLNNRHKIPAFYNPPLARGEDTFFSTLLGESKIIRIPVYHFHDGFLKYSSIMEGQYPKTLRKINIKENSVQIRFLQAAKGWIKYKPLLMYIKDKKNYDKNIEEMYRKLNESILKLNKAFNSDEFSILLKSLELYDMNVKDHYKEYVRTNKIWNHLKNKINNEVN